MCGRFALRLVLRDVARWFGLQSAGVDIQPRYNIAPTQPIAVIFASADGERTLGLMRWGFVPHWARDVAAGSPLINARSETAATKPTFRDAWKYRHCLIPADGYYEWEQLTDKARQPYFIRQPGDEPFAFAGLYDHWQDAHGNELESCAVLTMPSTGQMTRLHDRMPVTVQPDAWDRWLNPPTDPHAVALPPPLEPDSWELLAVSPRVNRVSEDSPRCIEPLDAPPTLFG